MSSNKLNPINRYNALSSDEHCEEFVQDESLSTNTTVEHVADSDATKQVAKTSKPKTWASLVTVATSVVETPDEPDIDRQTSDVNTKQSSSAVSTLSDPASEITSETTSETTDGWESVSHSKKKNDRKTGHRNNYGKDSNKQFGRSYDKNYKKNTYNYRDGSNASKHSETESVDSTALSESKVESSMPKRRMDVPVTPNVNTYASISAKGLSYKDTSDKDTSDKGTSDRAYTNNSVSAKSANTFFKSKASGSGSGSVSTKDETVTKKSFSAKPVENKTPLKLPEYYNVRSAENPYEIYQSEYEWVRRVGGLEKSETIDHMYKGTMACAISYFDNYMRTNGFFKDKISANLNVQDDLIELICMQTTAILFHRLIKSDSSEIAKTILKNLPLYRTVSGNPSERCNSKVPTNGSAAYLRVRRKFINDLRTSQTGSTDKACCDGDADDSVDNTLVSTSDEERIAATRAAAKARVVATEKKWLHYILQSVWNGNNPIHDCLYYGAKSSLEFIFCYCIEQGMPHQLYRMMIEPNIQNETHSMVLKNGINACDEHGSLNIIRRKQYNECSKLYENTEKLLRAQINNLIKEEADEIISMTTVNSNKLSNDVDSPKSEVEKDSAEEKVKALMNNDSVPKDNKDNTEDNTEDNAENNAEGDNVNICSLISNGDVEGMAKHIERCAKKQQFGIITKTFAFWKAAADADHTGQLHDYMSDVSFLCEDHLKQCPDLTQNNSSNI